MFDFKKKVASKRRANIICMDGTCPQMFLHEKEVSNCRFCYICYHFPTFESIRTGSIPKKGLIGIDGKISALGADGRGVIHIPPVSGKPYLFVNTFLILVWYHQKLLCESTM